MYHHRQVLWYLKSRVFRQRKRTNCAWCSHFFCPVLDSDTGYLFLLFPSEAVLVWVMSHQFSTNQPYTYINSEQNTKATKKTMAALCKFKLAPVCPNLPQPAPTCPCLPQPAPTCPCSLRHVSACHRSLSLSTFANLR